jgi:hypothetical protein
MVSIQPPKCGHDNRISTIYLGANESYGSAVA